jgi:hypothetical protein
MTRSCSRCGRTFETSRSYHRLCWDCWRADRDAKLRDDAYNEGFTAGRARARTNGGSDKIPPELLNDAVQLTHPDRRPPERAELANRVTAELLRLRERARSAP